MNFGSSKRVLILPAIVFAVIAACVVVLRAAEQAADVAGTWEMVAKGPQGDYDCDLVLEQKDNSLKGSVHTDFGDGPLEGRIKGNSIEFSATLEMEEGHIEMDYSGTVSGDTMKGKYSAADTTGTWSAVRPHSGQ